MKIQRLSRTDHGFDFRGGGYVMSHVTQRHLRVRILGLHTEDGTSGWGEIVRKAHVDLEKAQAEETALLDSLAGTGVDELPELCRDIRRRGPLLRGLAFGLETAWLDWLGRRSGQPLYALLGGGRGDGVAEYYSQSCDAPQEVEAGLRREAGGWAVVQVKLGVGGLEVDRRRVQAALDVLGPEQLILADFNGELDVASALAIISEFNDPRLVWEEPCNNVADNTKVAGESGRPVMFDQCLDDLSAIARVAADGLAHSVCIKPAFLGGLEPARAARDICIDAGVRMRVDGPWCGHVASAASLHLAATVPRELLIAGCDLRQAFELDEDWGGTEHLDGHHIAPAHGPGHGATPPWADTSAA